MKILMFAGSGGTGKTTLYRELCSRMGLTPLSSFTREAYSVLGVTNEKEYAKKLGDKEKVEFQSKLYEFYINKVEVLLEEGTFLFERSPIDHICYIMKSLEPLGNETDQVVLDMLLSKAEKLFTKMENPTILYFPYPAPWSNSSDVEDGFRLVDKDKDKDLDSIARKIISGSKHKWEIDKIVNIVDFPKGDFSLESRVNFVQSIFRN